MRPERACGFESHPGHSLPPLLGWRRRGLLLADTGMTACGASPARRQEMHVGIIWIVIVILAIVGLLALLGRGRFWGARRY